jgi:hypothetical protein
MHLISLKSLPQISITATELLFQFMNQHQHQHQHQHQRQQQQQQHAVEGVLFCGPPK